MFSVQADTKKNRLYITLGRLDPVEAQKAFLAVSRAVFKLKRGFTAVNDLTGYVPVSQNIAPLIRKAQNALISAGMGNSVRVALSKVAEIQFARRAKDAGYFAETVSTLKEADELLDKWVESQRKAGSET